MENKELRKRLADLLAELAPAPEINRDEIKVEVEGKRLNITLTGELAAMMQRAGYPPVYGGIDDEGGTE